MANNIKANTALNIRKIMIEKNIKNESDFADLLGISKQTLFNWKKRNTYDIDKIIEVFPDINRVWLLTGEGSMLKEYNQEKSECNDRLVEMINFLKYEKIISSQTDLAEKTGYNKSVISQMFNGKKHLTSKFIDNVNKLIANNGKKINYNYLIKGEGEMIIYQEQETNIKARFVKIINFLISERLVYNQQDLANILKVESSYISMMKRGIKPIGKKTITLLTDRFPQLDPIWLLKGEGSMLKEENQEKADTSINQRVIEAIDWLKENKKISSNNEFARKLGKHKSYISNVLNSKKPITAKFVKQIVNEFPDLNAAWLLTGEGSMLKGKDQEQKSNNGNIKYYYEMSATAYDLEISDNISEIEEPYNYLTIPGFRGECVAMNVAGNSMYPTAKNKDIVVVDANEVRNIIDGSVYMIIINDGHRMIKRLALDRESNLIKCISDNPDKELYPTFNIEPDMITRIFRVKGFLALTLF